jgi:hypothetical protein
MTEIFVNSLFRGMGKRCVSDIVKKSGDPHHLPRHSERFQFEAGNNLKFSFKSIAVFCCEHVEGSRRQMHYA